MMETVPSAPVIAAGTRLRAAGVVIASTLGNALSVTPTVSAVFGVVLVPITLEFNWSRAEVSVAAAVVSLATALCTPIAGWMADVVGPRRTALIGSLALGLTIASLGLARPHAVLFYLQFGLIGAVGALQSAVIYAKLLAEWFDKQRGLWMGVASGASGLGYAIMPAIASATLDTLGWRGSFICVALVILLIGLPVQFFFLKAASASQPVGGGLQQPPLELEGLSARQAFKTRTFWLLLTSLPIGGGILIAVAVTIVPIFMDRGVSLGLATGAVATIGLTSSIGEAGIGFLLDRSKSPRRLSLFYLAAVSGSILLLVGNGSLAIVAGALIGIGMAGEFSALSFMISRYFGRKAFGTISGLGFGVMLVVGSLATVLLNVIYDATGSYRLAIIGIIPVLIWNTVAPLMMGRYRYKPDEPAV